MARKKEKASRRKAQKTTRRARRRSYVTNPGRPAARRRRSYRRNPGGPAVEKIVLILSAVLGAVFGNKIAQKLPASIPATVRNLGMMAAGLALAWFGYKKPAALGAGVGLAVAGASRQIVSTVPALAGDYELLPEEQEEIRSLADNLSGDDDEEMDEDLDGGLEGGLNGGLNGGMN